MVKAIDLAGKMWCSSCITFTLRVCLARYGFSRFFLHTPLISDDDDRVISSYLNVESFNISLATNWLSFSAIFIYIACKHSTFYDMSGFKIDNRCSVDSRYFGSINCCGSTGKVLHEVSDNILPD